eukprot:194988_1
MNSHHRLLLNSDRLDILNLNTYDEFDWIILVLSLITFACIWCIVGWCFHAICVNNKILGNHTEEDVETLSYRLSPTHRRSTITNVLHRLSNFGSNISTNRLSKRKISSIMLTSDVNIHHLELPENNQMQTIPSNAEITSDLVNSRFVFVDETFKNQVSMKYLEASKTPSIIATPE